MESFKNVWLLFFFQKYMFVFNKYTANKLISIIKKKEIRFHRIVRRIERKHLKNEFGFEKTKMGL